MFTSLGEIIQDLRSNKSIERATVLQKKKIDQECIHEGRGEMFESF